MKPALLLVDHGSRRAEANAALDALAEQVRAAEPGRVVQTAHMELAAPSVADGFAACVAAGAREVVVVPVFLARGSHGAEDVPALARRAAARHPGVPIRVTDALGLDERIADVVVERVGRAR